MPNWKALFGGNDRDQEEATRMMQPLGPGEWERELDKPAFVRRGVYRPIVSLSPAQARDRLERMGRDEMPLELVQPEPVSSNHAVSSPPQVEPALPPPDPEKVLFRMEEPVRFEMVVLPWLPEGPTEPGAYWIRNCRDELNMVVVKSFGGRLCVLIRGSGSVVYKGVASMPYKWAGPVPIPEDATLEELNDRLA